MQGEKLKNIKFKWVLKVNQTHNKYQNPKLMIKIERARFLTIKNKLNLKYLSKKKRRREVNIQCFKKLIETQNQEKQSKHYSVQLLLQLECSIAITSCSTSVYSILTSTISKKKPRRNKIISFCNLNAKRLVINS